MSSTRRNILTIVGLAIGLKLMYVVFTVALANAGFEFQCYEDFTFSTFNDRGKFDDMYIRNDAGWYKQIATNGHHKILTRQLKPNKVDGWIQSYYAFFPLFPFSVVGLQMLTGLPYTYAAILLVTLFSIAGFCLLYYFIALFSNSTKVALTSVIILMLFPFTYYFSMPMTESLFLLLLTLCFIGVYHKNIALMAIAGALLVLVRPNGIIMSVPLGLFYLERHVFTNSWRLPQKSDWLNFLPGIALGTMPIAFFAYCFYLKEMTGDFFAFSTAQAGWGKAWTNPLIVLVKYTGWRYVVEVSFTLFAMVVAVLGRRIIPLSFQVLIWTSLLLPLWAGTTISMPRYISLIFPIFILMAYYVSNHIKKTALLYIGLTALHLFSFYFWLKPDNLSF